MNSEAEHLAEEIKDIEEKIERHKVYGVGNASPGDFQARRGQLEEVMTEIEKT